MFIVFVKFENCVCVIKMVQVKFFPFFFLIKSIKTEMGFKYKKTKKKKIVGWKVDTQQQRQQQHKKGRNLCMFDWLVGWCRGGCESAPTTDRIPPNPTYIYCHINVYADAVVYGVPDPRPVCRVPYIYIADFYVNHFFLLSCYACFTNTIDGFAKDGADLFRRLCVLCMEFSEYICLYIHLCMAWLIYAMFVRSFRNKILA